MAKKRISQFSDGGAFASGDAILIARDGENFQMNGAIIATTIANLANIVGQVSSLDTTSTVANERLTTLEANTLTLSDRIDSLEGIDPQELAAVATSGAYADLTGLPALFSGAYADLTGLPALFSGAYADLAGKPALFSGAYTDLTGKPVIPTKTSQLENDMGYGTGSGGSTGPKASHRGGFSADVIDVTHTFDTGVLPNRWSISSSVGTTPVFREVPDEAIGTTRVFEYPDIADNQNATLTFDVRADAAKNVVRFRYRGHTERTVDLLTVIIDGTVTTTRFLSNEDSGWIAAEFTVPVGNHTVGLRYSKDASRSTGYDNFRFSQITIPVPGSLPYVFGDIVVFNGRNYLCLITGTANPPTSTTDWVRLDLPGSSLSIPTPSMLSDLTTSAFGATPATLTNDVDLGLVFDYGTIVQGFGARAAYASPPTGNWQATVRAHISVPIAQTQVCGIAMVGSGTGGLIFGFANSPNVPICSRVATFPRGGDGYTALRTPRTLSVEYKWHRITYNATTKVAVFLSSTNGRIWTEVDRYDISATIGVPSKIGLGILGGETNGLPSSMDVSHFEIKSI